MDNFFLLIGLSWMLLKMSIKPAQTFMVLIIWWNTKNIIRQYVWKIERYKTLYYKEESKLSVINQEYKAYLARIEESMHKNPKQLWSLIQAERRYTRVMKYYNETVATSKYCWQFCWLIWEHIYCLRTPKYRLTENILQFNNYYFVCLGGCNHICTEEIKKKIVYNRRRCS